MSTDLAQHIDQNEELQTTVVDDAGGNENEISQPLNATSSASGGDTPPQKKTMEKVNSNEEEEETVQSGPQPADGPKTPSDNDTGSLATYFSDAFTWLDPILCYSPLWIAKPTAIANKKASKLDYVVLSLNIAFVLVWFILQLFYQITRWYIYSDIDNVIWCAYIACCSSSRLLSIMYCYKYFNWPWKPEALHFEYQQEDLNQRYMSFIATCKRLAILLAISYIILDLVVIVLETEALLTYYHDSLVAYILVKTLCRTILDYPQMIVTIIQSIVILKYCLRLHQLYDENMHSKNLSTVDVHDLWESYKNLYKSFKRDYHWTLRFSLILYLAAQVFFFWDSLNFIGMFVMFVIAVREFPIFVLYFYTASILESIHHKFSKELWANGHGLISAKDGYYNYTLHYIKQYPIFLKVGPVVITSINVFKFIIGLFITRGVTFAVRHWVEENY